MQQPGSAPMGAQCAIHLGESAHATCARCGSFMCHVCSEGGTVGYCPTCRAHASVGSFAFTRDDFDFARLWEHVFAAFKRDWLMLSVGVVILVGFIMGGSFISGLLSGIINGFVTATGADGAVTTVVGMAVGQAIGAVIGTVVQGAALMGLYRLLIDSLLGRGVDLGRMFSLFPKLGRYIVANLLLFVIVTLPMLTALALYALAVLASIGTVDFKNFDAQAVWSSIGPAALMGGLALAFGVLAYSLIVLPLSLFTPAEVALSNDSPIEVLKRVWRIASGHRLTVIGYSFAAGLIMIVSVFVCCIGMVPGMALAYMLTMALFLSLRASSEFPPPDFG